MAEDRKRVTTVGSAELPLAHGRTEGGSKDSDPEGKTQGFILRGNIVISPREQDYAVLSGRFMVE